jgi:hypothetical protein
MRIVPSSLAALGLLAVAQTPATDAWRQASTGRTRARAIESAQAAKPVHGSTAVLLGDDAVEQYQSHLDRGRAEAFRMRARASGITGGANLYIGSRNKARTVVVGVYSDARGQPGSLLSVGALSSPRARAWNRISLTPVHLVTGARYWLAIFAQGGALRYRSRRGGSCLHTPELSLRGRVLPARWSGARPRSRVHCPISAYVGPVATPVTPVTGTAPIAPRGGTGPTGPTSSASATGCFADPEACGYPGPNNTGPGGEGEKKCASYPEEGYGEARTAGETIKEKRFTRFTVVASNVTLNDVCIISNNSEFTIMNLYEGSNFTIENSVIRGATANPGTEAAIWDTPNLTPSPRAINDLMSNCDECIHGGWNVQNSYAISNGENGGHTETWFTDGESIAEHDTLLNPSKQTAVFEGSGTSVKLTNSLVGGGGWTLYSRAGGSHFEVVDNRFARKVCTKAIIPDVEARGGHECSGEPGEKVNFYDSGEGSGGYYPYGGFFGLETASGGGGSFSRWEGNYWDDNLQPARESATGK